jgi:hypothetical protein
MSNKKQINMDNDLYPHIISSLQMEYNAHRQEIRDLVSSMDTNLNTGIIMLTGIIAFATYLQQPFILFIVPSAIFIISSIHLLKTASSFVHGAYCQAIEARLKLLLGKDKVLFNWEDGKIGKYVSKPTGIVQIGFYLFFFGILSIYGYIAYLSFKWLWWTAIVHFIELIAIGIYFIHIIRWSTSSTHAELLKDDTLIDSELLASNDNLSKTQQ